MENVVKGEECPICHKKTLMLQETQKEVPYFGNVFVFSMTCENCRYYKADIEIEKQQEPVKYSIDVSGEEDMKIRVVKSAEAKVKFARIGDISPGPASNGYITNIEGLLNRMKRMIEQVRDNQDEDKTIRKKAKNQIKKIQNTVWGRDTIKIVIEDPSGNSAIISDKAKKEKLK